MDESEKPKLSRRRFLTLSLGTILGGYAMHKFGSPALALEDNNSTQQLTSVKNPQSYTETNIEQIPKKETIEGVEVYGTLEPINTQQDARNLSDYLTKLFTQRVSDEAKQLNKPIPNDKWESREMVLDPTTRFLEVFVKRSIYQKFQQEAQQKGVNFVAWLKQHVEIMNNFITGGIQPVDLTVNLLRVVVVDDSFDDRLTEHQNMPPYPPDIDARWFVNNDYRGDVNPVTGKEERSDYVQTHLINGKEIVIDYGLIHEWYHMLLNYTDEYIQNVDNIPGIPKLYIRGVSALESRSAWSSYCLKRVQQLGIRGYYTDPRGKGVAGYKDIKDSADFVWAQRPEKNSFLFTGSGSPLEGKIEVYKVRIDRDYYSQKRFELCHEEEMKNGELIFDDWWFEPQRQNDSVIVPTNFFVKITTQKGEIYQLHLPISFFNMSKIAGLDEANYTINFKNYQKLFKTQIITMTEEKLSPYVSTQESSKLDQPYAEMQVDGTPVKFLWSNES